ncbi:hypothetical protein FJV46_10560 [Arthrobacter agilis]|uniref:hypothetical protein n=1 Tax=Arthrobacter agilis TaxID=37921 RepID=UPI000B3627AE|nr:hypothetical protein [Arthrobacter agilis]OUM44182.1 hypothetical protein B8W74_04720 [Arthrobacter agilis]PPB46557.1 hypothetical protein CI784_07015 [Arthrobacter agilis]TPV23786.1 hypothetical protein FJV46_10560 [Arthrobacter agilis]VDR32517.1 Uncharacterised protein [Arthrobacter agilis]
MSDPVAAVEAGFAAGTAERLRVLEVRAQTQAQRAADELARGNHDYGVMLLVCALITTEQIDNTPSEGTS